MIFDAISGESLKTLMALNFNKKFKME